MTEADVTGSVDGSTITTSCELQAAVTAAATEGQAVRIKPGQAIAMSSTVTIPQGGGIVCDTVATWIIGTVPSYRPVLMAQLGFTGPMIKVEANTYGVRLRGFEIDANAESGVTFGLFFDLIGPAYLTNTHQIEELGVRHVTNGTGIGGRVQCANFRNIHAFHCDIGVKVGGAGSWFDTKWHGGFVAYCKTAGIQLAADGFGTPPALVQFSDIRSERNGQTPYDPNHATGDPWWGNTSPGWDVKAARHCAWINCTTDANNGPGFRAVPAAAGKGYDIGNNIVTGCIWHRDGVTTGTAFNPSSYGVQVEGLSPAAADHVGPIAFRNCVVSFGHSSDAGDSTYSSPAYGVRVDRADQFTWMGNASGVTKGMSFGTRDLWRPMVMDNRAELYLIHGSFTTTVPRVSAV